MTTAPEPVTGGIAGSVAAAVLACPAVAALHGGRHGEVATYLPGRRITGVRVAGTGVTVHLAGRYPATIAETAAQVRAAVGSVVAGVPVTVVVEDILAPTAGTSSAGLPHTKGAS
ncbi:hypothetical protein JOF53_001420 [Crossiella equi]|uniref:Asp23/Gls24 family envelope stress response protein n=1 Tax=Crossiella equi TaxID=130796 RepID=A0ABS5A7I5_9PSEU|nr:hypothetical protein [Crossiella equi]MBP2472548.1 hypothetical protein [Crossiella equi]